METLTQPVRPALGSAIYKGNMPLAAMYGLSVGMLASMASTTKDAIGRYSGSILDPKRENAPEIATTLLEGRFFRAPGRNRRNPPCNCNRNPYIISA